MESASRVRARRDSLLKGSSLSARCGFLCRGAGTGAVHRRSDSDSQPVAPSLALCAAPRRPRTPRARFLRRECGGRALGRGTPGARVSACILSAADGGRIHRRAPRRDAGATAADYGSAGRRGPEAHVSGSWRKKGKQRRSSSSSSPSSAGSSTAAAGNGGDFRTAGWQPSAHQNVEPGGRVSSGPPSGPEGGAAGHAEPERASPAVGVIVVARLAVVTTARRRRGRVSLEPRGRPIGRGPSNMVALRCGGWTCAAAAPCA